MVASWKGHPLISGKSGLVSDPVWGPGKVVHFWANMLFLFLIWLIWEGQAILECVWFVVVVGCPMSHTLSRWETLDEFFSGIQDLSFHNLPSILLVVASTNNPGHPTRNITC